MADLLLVQDAVAERLQQQDPQQKLTSSDYQDILEDIANKVHKVLCEESRMTLDEEDRAFIQRRVRQRVRRCLDAYLAEQSKLRFERFERVMCNLGPEWAAGNVQALNEADPEDPSGRTRLPYVVKIDPPNGRLISVPKDAETHCRAEVCFGQRAGALWFTLFALPAPRKGGVKKLRFAAGDRVVCAVEEAAGAYTVWAAGTVTACDVSVGPDAVALMPERDWSDANSRVPYRVQLDGGGSVLCHRDEHWLIRDLSLQPQGVRTSADGTRALQRLEKRPRAEGGWEAVDHATRNVRAAGPPDEDDDDA